MPEVSRYYRVVIKAFASGQCGPVRAQARAEDGETLTILQSGDPASHVTQVARILVLVTITYCTVVRTEILFLDAIAIKIHS